MAIERSTEPFNFFLRLKRGVKKEIKRGKEELLKRAYLFNLKKKLNGYLGVRAVPYNQPRSLKASVVFQDDQHYREPP